MRSRAVSLTVLFVLAACGGGGGGGGTGGGGGGGGTPPVAYANTSSQYYLPLRAGNVWTFSSGGSIHDMGPIAVSCNCAINGQSVEALELVDPDGVTVAGAFYFAKSTSSHASVLTNLMAIEQSGGSPELVTDGVTFGLTVMDDAATQGETWTLAGETSTITSVGQTQPYQNETIRNVNEDTVSDTSGSLGFGFAQGVGFTSVSESGDTITLTAFTIDAANSTAVARAPRSLRLGGAARTSSAAALLRALF